MNIMLRLSPSSNNIFGWDTDPLNSGEYFVDFRVYRLDMSSPTMTLLSTITRPDRSVDSHFKFQDGILAIGWEESGSFMLYIRQFSLSEYEPETEVVMDLGYQLVRSSIV